MHSSFAVSKLSFPTIAVISLRASLFIVVPESDGQLNGIYLLHCTFLCYRCQETVAAGSSVKDGHTSLCRAGKGEVPVPLFLLTLIAKFSM